jgi:hypothetical protein
MTQPHIPKHCNLHNKYPHSVSNTATVEKIKQNEMNEKDDREVGGKNEV